MSKPISDRQLKYIEYVQREEGVRHQNTEEDLLPIDLLRNGDMRAVEAMKTLMQSRQGAMKTSEDPLRNAQYLFVACVTLAGRAAQSAGMDSERANIASDLFIQKVDKMTNVQEINDYSLEMIRFYTQEVAALDKKRSYSRTVNRGLDYIYYHLHEPINVDTIAQALGLSRGYFSSLFKKEMGIGVAAYIQKKRMEAARNMLRYSDMSYVEISQTLAFSSQSHFIQVFKKETGMTPRQYREGGEG